MGGNTLVRAGVVVLFVGLAFLVQYAVEHQLFPLELRLAATGATGILLAVVGWRLRTRRREFGLTLQGGGLAILYLTVFATFRLYALIPAGAALTLLFVTAVLGGALAVLQNAQALAVLSLLGGFFAPVLATTGEGSHIALFTYFAILNLTVLAMAWYRPWRVMNVTGFLCTFGFAGLWVVNAFEPAMRLEAVVFLVIYFAIYFGVGVFQVRQDGGRLALPMDRLLVFGLPLVVLSIQAPLVRDVPYGLAWSTFAFGAFYAAVAMVIYRRSPRVLLSLVESFAGIGLVLGTLVLPFALNATWTGAGWAAEGALLVWLGFRQRGVLLRSAGALLILLAMLALVRAGSVPTPTIPIFHASFMAYLSVAAASTIVGYLYFSRRAADARAWEAPLAPFFLTLGWLWWLVAGMSEVGHLTYDAVAVHIRAALISLTALAYAAASRSLNWTAPRVIALLALPMLFPLLALSAFFVSHPFAAGGAVAWPLAIAAHLVCLRMTDESLRRRVGDVLHGMTLWFAAIVLSWELTWALRTFSAQGGVWPDLGAGITLIAIVLIVTALIPRLGWPFGRWRGGYLTWGMVPLLTAAWYWSVMMSSASPGNPAPLTYIPFLNPLDVVLGFGVLAAIYWYRSARAALTLNGSGVRTALIWLLSGTAFLWLNATLARTVHAHIGVPYHLDALLASTPFQTGLTIMWAVLSVSVMAIAARKAARRPWIAAASLLGITVVKLFAVDLAAIGTVPRIITFIIVGLLLLIVGYLAPVPPERATSPRPAGESPDIIA